MNLNQAYKLLQKQIDECGSQTKFAKKYNISTAYVNDAISRRTRPLGPKILKALKLKKKIVYIKR